MNIFVDGNQQNVKLAALTGGGYVAVWNSDDQNGTGLGLTAQLFNEFGQRIGAPFFIEQTTLGNQTIGTSQTRRMAGSW
ncbi:hypothetical protein RGUI_4317 (plasmid) [Rhodovulum sp. P5]|nr:hypothetical protein RGUI_4317 [Rhodovulum sp. P5]